MGGILLLVGSTGCANGDDAVKPPIIKHGLCNPSPVKDMMPLIGQCSWECAHRNQHNNAIRSCYRYGRSGMM